ncbi:MAG: hypothetical protein U0X75_18135 [Acidobacteriota bacterium]
MDRLGAASVFVTLFIVLGLVFSDAKQRRLRVKQDIAAAEAMRESLLAEAAAFQQGNCDANTERDFDGF